VDLATDESCAKAVSKLQRHHPGVEMGRTTALRLLHEHGGKARKFIDERLVGACRLAEEPTARQGEQAAELEVQYDGGMIPVATLEPIKPEQGKAPELTPVCGLPKRRKVCRYEEVKAGLVQNPGEVDRLYTLRPTGQLDETFDDLFGLAVLKGWTEKAEVRGLADGAITIRPRRAETFHSSSFRFILDRPHCKEHLSAAGAELSPITGIPAEAWATAALSTLEAGRSDEVVAELRRAWEASGARVAPRQRRRRPRARDAQGQRMVGGLLDRSTTAMEASCSYLRRGTAVSGRLSSDTTSRAAQGPRTARPSPACPPWSPRRRRASGSRPAPSAALRPARAPALSPRTSGRSSAA
jgi:hypothetical protein